MLHQGLCRGNGGSALRRHQSCCHVCMMRCLFKHAGGSPTRKLAPSAQHTCHPFAVCSQTALRHVYTFQMYKHRVAGALGCADSALCDPNLSLTALVPVISPADLVFALPDSRRPRPVTHGRCWVLLPVTQWTCKLSVLPTRCTWAREQPITDRKGLPRSQAMAVWA